MERNFPDGKQDMVRAVWPGQSQRLQKEAKMGQRIVQAQSLQKTSCHNKFCLFSDFKHFCLPIIMSNMTGKSKRLGRLVS